MRPLRSHRYRSIAVVALLLMSAGACTTQEGRTVPPSATNGVLQPSATAATSTPASTFTDLPHISIDADGDRAFPEFTREDFLREEWRRTGLAGDPPEVDLIEVVHDGPLVDGLAPWNRKFVECLTEAGFPPESIDENGIQFVTPPEQQDAFNLADYTCNAQYSMDLSRMQPYNEKQIRMVYDWIVAETIPCYERNGQTVTGVPTRDAFADEWFASRRHWVPEDGVDGEVTGAVLKECPRIPPPEILYGSS